MNKFGADNVRAIAARSKKCLLGQIETDINSRLPTPPEPLTGWEKFKLIKSGQATLRRNIRMKDVMPTYSRDEVSLVDAFEYPVREEQEAYDNAFKGIQSEKNTREIAVERAFDRAVDERICELIDSKGFLDKIEELSSQNW